MRKNPQYGRFPNRAELGRPRAASRKSMAIGGSKRKWRNAVGFAGSLAAAAGVELSGYRRDRRCHAYATERSEEKSKTLIASITSKLNDSRNQRDILQVH